MRQCNFVTNHTGLVQGHLWSVSSWTEVIRAKDVAQEAKYTAFRFVGGLGVITCKVFVCCVKSNDSLMPLPLALAAHELLTHSKLISRPSVVTHSIIVLNYIMTHKSNKYVCDPSSSNTTCSDHKPSLISASSSVEGTSHCAISLDSTFASMPSMYL